MTPSAAKPISTHGWMYAITVENEFRNARGYIEYRWYTPVVTRFEASWVAGPKPTRTRPEARIRVYVGERLVGAHVSKAEAVGQVRTLLATCPVGCRAGFAEHGNVLIEAIIGR